MRLEIKNKKGLRYYLRNKDDIFGHKLKNSYKKLSIFICMLLTFKFTHYTPYLTFGGFTMLKNITTFYFILIISQNILFKDTFIVRAQSNLRIHNHSSRPSPIETERREERVWMMHILETEDDIDVYDYNGRTPLFVAVTHNDPELVKTFLEAGANPIAIVISERSIETTPLRYALDIDNEISLEIVASLIRARDSDWFDSLPTPLSARKAAMLLFTADHPSLSFLSQYIIEELR